MMKFIIDLGIWKKWSKVSTAILALAVLVGTGRCNPLPVFLDYVLLT